MADTQGTEPDHCASCVHFSRERSNLSHLGFGHCVHVPLWRHFNASAPCRFFPSRWSPGRAKPDPAAAMVAPPAG